VTTADQLDLNLDYGRTRDLGEINPASDTCQRWGDRRHSWVRRSAGGFDPARYTVAPIPEAAAKAFVVRHHYAGTYPAASRRYGLTDAGRLLGVAVFSIPAQARVLTNVFPTLAPYTESLELGRFVLVDGPPGNTESWFLAQCFAHLAADGIRGVVSFADPVPRNVGGRTLFPGHVGTIYQASNALFTGRGTARTLTVLPDGTSLSDRALQKVRRGEVGHEYVERRLVGYGARQMRGATGAAWLTDALNDVGAARLRHRGCLRYAMTTSHRDRGLVVTGRGLPYPKRADAA
jgi:hypothetical protein